MLRAVMRSSHKSWDEYEYNRVVHKTTNISPFEVVYDFNPLTPLDLSPLPNPQTFVMEEAQAHDRKNPSPSPNTSSSFSSSPTNRRSGPTKHHWISFFVITFEYF